MKVAVRTLSTTNISKKGLMYYKVFKERVGVLQIFPKMGWGTDDLHKKGGENAQKMQKYV